MSKETLNAEKIAAAKDIINQETKEFGGFEVLFEIYREIYGDDEMTEESFILDVMEQGEIMEGESFDDLVRFGVINVASGLGFVPEQVGRDVEMVEPTVKVFYLTDVVEDKRSIVLAGVPDNIITAINQALAGNEREFSGVRLFLWDGDNESVAGTNIGVGNVERMENGVIYKTGNESIGFYYDLYEEEVFAGQVKPDIGNAVLVLLTV